MYFLPLMIVLVLLLGIFYYYKNKRFYSLLAKIPGPKAGSLLLGDMDLVFKNSCDQSVNQVYQIFTAFSVVYADQGIFKLRNGPLDFVFIFHYDLVQDFLKDNNNLEKPFEYQILYDWLGKGLLINDNTSLWRHRRKLLTPAFHFKIIDEFLPVFNEKSNILVENLKSFVGKKSFDLSPLLFSCTLDAIAETTLGVQLNCQQNQNLDYFKAVHRSTEIFFYRLLRPWLFPKFLFYLTKVGREWRDNLKVLHGLSQRVINEKKHKMLSERQNTDLENINKKKKRLAFLDLLLDLHLRDNSFTLEDIQEEVDTFMFAGHDTSACCLNWTFFLLGSHPEIQNRLQEELDSIISKEEDITMNHIKQFTYLEAVIKESMRLYPPVPVITRKITEDMKIGEYVLPKGISLYLMIGRLHRDPKVFEEPLHFKPERFLSENQSSNDNPFYFTPFSAGARSCIGQKFAFNELKIIIAKVLMNYSLESLEDRSDIIVLNSIVSKPLNGLKVRLQHRLFD